MRHTPLLPTLLVAIAVATMLALGLWQLRRADEKAARLARYEAARSLSSAVSWPRDPEEVDRALYRHSRVVCDRVLAHRAVAGRSAAGEPGWALVARCALDGGGEAEVALGWSREPRQPAWRGGEALGFVAPGGGDGARLIAVPPLAGLEPLAPPDPRDIPNNHLAYAVQWFVFAATAVVIYLLALRSRTRRG